MYVCWCAGIGVSQSVRESVCMCVCVGVKLLFKLSASSPLSILNR